MKKRGKQRKAQITIFTGIGIVLLLASLFFIFFYGEGKEISTKRPDIRDIVTKYAETCLKMVTENATFNRIGVQGGYINPNGDADYGDVGVPAGSPIPTIHEGHTVPYYLNADCYERHCHRWNICCAPPPPAGDGSCSPCHPCLDERCHWSFEDYFPDETQDISEKIENYIKVEFDKCFKSNVFEEIGINVNKPNTADIKVEASLNEGDISIELIYPLTLKKDETEIEIDLFRITLPFRLKALYNNAKYIVNQVKNANIVDGIPHSPSTPPRFPYTITPDDCTSIDKDNAVNLFIKLSDSGEKEIVQFIDYSTLGNGYLRSYIFQFAVKNINIEKFCNDGRVS